MCGKNEFAKDIGASLLILLLVLNTRISLSFIVTPLLKTACNSKDERHVRNWKAGEAKHDYGALGNSENKIWSVKKYENDFLPHFYWHMHITSLSRACADSYSCKWDYWNGPKMVTAINKVLIIFNGGKLN